MDLNTYTQLIIKYEHKLSALSQGKILLVANLINGGLLHDSKCLQDNAACFSDDSVEALEALVQADFPDSYTGPVVIDMTKAVTLYRESSEKEDERIKTALLMSRVNFMGTDGIRGKVVLKTNEHCIADLLKDNAFTPGLVEITAFSFAKLLVDNEIVKADDTVIISPEMPFVPEESRRVMVKSTGWFNVVVLRPSRSIIVPKTLTTVWAETAPPVAVTVISRLVGSPAVVSVAVAVPVSSVVPRTT